MRFEPTWMTDHDRSTCRVLAGPYGFYGCAYGAVVGKRCETVSEAWAQADIAAALVEMGGATGAIHAWRLVN